MKFNTRSRNQFDNDLRTFPIALNYNDIVPGHANTSRVGYTTAAGMAFYVTGIGISMKEGVLATTTGTAKGSVLITPDGGASVLLAIIHIYAGVVLHSKSLMLPCHHIMTGGDLLNIQTEDFSAGGTMEYDITVTGYRVVL